jgi:hypothetical protein
MAKKPTIINHGQKFIVLEPHPKGEFVGQGPVIALDPPQPWGRIAIKVQIGGPVFVNNVPSSKSIQYQHSAEPLLVAAQRLWHLARQCGITAEAWRWLQMCLPANYVSPPIRELPEVVLAMAPPAPKAPPTVKPAAKPAPRKATKAEAPPFDGGVPAAEHMALVQAARKPARRTKADTRDATPAPVQETEPRETSVAGRIRQLLSSGKDDETTWSTVKAEFGLPEQGRTQIARVRRQMTTAIN